MWRRSGSLRPSGPALWSSTYLSSLFHDGGVGCGAALGGADESAGAQETKAGGWDIPRGDLVLAWVPPAHAATHRAGCREGVGLPKAATGRGAENGEPSSPLALPQPQAVSRVRGCQQRAMIKRTAKRHPGAHITGTVLGFLLRSFSPHNPVKWALLSPTAGEIKQKS